MINLSDNGSPSLWRLLLLHPLALCRRRALDEVHLDKHLIRQVDSFVALTLEHEASGLENRDKGRDVRLAASVLHAIDLDGEVLVVGAVVILALGLLAGGHLLPVANAVRHEGVLAADGAEAGLDLGDPELALPVEDAVGLLDKVDPVGAHQGEAEDGDVDGAVGDGEVGDVGLCDEGAGGLEIEALDLHAQLLLVRLQHLRDPRIATPQVRNRALLLRPGQDSLGPGRGRRAGAAPTLGLDAAAGADVLEEAVDGVLGPHLDLAPEALVVLVEHLGRVGEELEGLLRGPCVQRLVEVAEARRDELLAHRGLEGREFGGRGRWCFCDGGGFGRC